MQSGKILMLVLVYPGQALYEEYTAIYIRDWHCEGTKNKRVESEVSQNREK